MSRSTTETPWSIKRYTGLRFEAEDKDTLLDRIAAVFDPLADVRSQAEMYRRNGVEVEEVVLKVGNERCVLTFDEFKAQYLNDR